jgi:hypothetical protein
MRRIGRALTCRRVGVCAGAQMEEVRRSAEIQHLGRKT